MTVESWFVRSLCVATLLAFLHAGTLAGGNDEPGTTSPSEPEVAAEDDVRNRETAQREARFAKRMSGATLVGHFTDSNREGLLPQQERYTLGTVSKLADGKWLFQARIQYAEHDLTIPLALPVKWAGDTPVITVDDFLVPGLGKFTSRVMVYEDHYAGFWRGGNHGGHLFGKLEPASDADASGDSDDN